MGNNLCEFCGKEINNKGSLVKHQNGCKLNPNRKVYKSNFIDYNKKVKIKTPLGAIHYAI